MIVRSFLFILLVIILFPKENYGQNYGLEFSSYSTQKDLRTGLNLTPSQKLELSSDFELSFQLSLYTHDQIFGYVLRAILNDTLNIDIQINYTQNLDGNISVIVGQQIYNFPSWVLNHQFYEEWNDISIKFNVAENQIVFFKNGIANKVNLKFPESISMSLDFGSINAGRFITTDVPPMQLRNIQLRTKNKILRKWPLDEVNGTVVHDKVQNTPAEVLNPHWIKPEYSNWHLSRKLALPGIVASTYNERTNEMLFLTKDSLLAYPLTIKGNKLKTIARDDQMVNPDSRILVDYSRNIPFHYYLDTKSFIQYDSVRKRWDQQLSNKSRSIRDFTQHNSLYSPRDTSFYFFGGYGFYTYKNSFYKYHIPSRSFEEVRLTGDKINPRYLAAMGASPDCDSIYVLGGYGSVTGDQRINPQSFRDLYVIDVKKTMSTRLAVMNNLRDDYCFARSLYVFPSQNAYYALCFTKHKFHSWLQLIKGNLKTGSFELLGDSIPYMFDDIRSNADLFYSKETKELISTTSIYNQVSDSTFLEVYTIQFPPNNLNKITGDANKGKGPLVLLISIAAVAFILSILIVIVVVKHKKKPASAIHGYDVESVPLPLAGVIITERRQKEMKNYISLLGEFQIYDNGGAEISKQFSPLLKELFLLIFFYSQNDRKGISTEMMSQLLWFDKNSSQARNNRSVNMSKLRHILEKIDGIDLLKKNGYWNIEILPDKLKVDYLEVMSYINLGQIPSESINSYISLIKKGSLLIETNYEWLDKIKSEFTNAVLDLLFEFEKTNKKDPDLNIKIADAIFVHDSLNEVAMKMKYNALISLGRHHLAKVLLEQFKIEYLSLYGEPFVEGNM